MGKNKKRKSAHRNVVDPSAPLPTTTVSSQSSGIRSSGDYASWTKSWYSNTQRDRDRVQKSRFLEEKLSLVGNLNTMLPEEALGDGLSATSDSKNLAFREKATELFDRWGSTNAIDVAGKYNIYSCQSMLGHYMLRDGEILVKKVVDEGLLDSNPDLADKSKRALQLQFLRRDQIGNGPAGVSLFEPCENGSRWEDGILANCLDEPELYRVLKRGGIAGVSVEYDDIEAHRMIHVRLPDLEGVHGMPWLFGGEESALDLLDIRSLSKFADKIRAAFLGAITTPSGSAPVSMQPHMAKGANPADEKQRYFEIGGGVQIPVLKTGEDISFFTGQSITFEAQVALLWREIIMRYGYPGEYLWNLSALGSAAVRLLAKKVGRGHNRIRRPIREIFLQQVWEFVIGDAIERGELPLVDDWNVIVCKGATDPSIDAGRDEKAEQEKLRTFTGTIESYCDAHGLTGRKVRRARLEEIADNIRVGVGELGLPWFLCVDPLQIQAVAGMASAMGIDLNEIGKEIAARIKE